MKKILIVAFAVITNTLVYSQANRFIYVVTMKPNSKDATNIQKENVYLDTNGKQSIFIPEKTVQRDSIFQRNRQTNQRVEFGQMENYRSQITYTISKDLSNNETTFKNRIGRDIYSYTEPMDLKWKIEPETMKIDKYTAQKATTSYGGRNWTAWFTNEIPLSNGPYKFGGLPGLIIKMTDDKGDYVFEMAESKKIAEMATTNQFGQTIKIKKPDYIKMEKKYKEDPEAYFQAQANGAPRPPVSMNGGGEGRGGRQGGNGGGQRGGDFRTRMIEDIKNNNNPIELQ
jgi:GLPGLI family protein